MTEPPSDAELLREIRNLLKREADHAETERRVLRGRDITGLEYLSWFATIACVLLIIANVVAAGRVDDKSGCSQLALLSAAALLLVGVVACVWFRRNDARW